MTPDLYCEEKVRASHSNFARSFRLLSAERRRAMNALYAFCREVDDVVDGPTDPAVAMAKLQWWRMEVASVYHGRPAHPVTRALSLLVAPFRLQEEWLVEIIDGMEMDLTRHRYATYGELQLYCHRVAAVVGWSVAQILGYSNLDTLKYAHSMGIACQLTNIIRDVAEDARRGRIYLPQEEMNHFAVSEADILSSRMNENYAHLMEFQVTRVKEIFKLCLSQLPKEDVRAQRAGLAMGLTYRALLTQIHKVGFAPPPVRVSLAAPYRLWMVFFTWLFPKSQVTWHLR